MRQFCAECGQEMAQRDYGAWNMCCSGLGYWASAAPLPRDSWWPVTQRNGLTFYPTAKWPQGKQPTSPLWDE